MKVYLPVISPIIVFSLVENAIQITIKYHSFIELLQRITN